jgi:hypothetical protein
LFYRFVNDERLRNRYREAGFYQPFLTPGDSEIKNAISPYENVNLKLFTAMRKVAAQSLNPHQPLIIAIVDAYTSLFPEEAEAIYGVFLRTTHGVTTSQELATAFEGAASAGRRGDIEAFRQRSAAAFALLKATTEQVAQGKLALGANLGPELWVVNSGFKIAPAVWERDRTLPLTLNLNTATEAELMTLPGVDWTTAQRLVAERRARGFFKSLDELRAAARLSPGLIKSLVEMSAQMQKEKEYKRQ